MPIILILPTIYLWFESLEKMLVGGQSLQLLSSQSVCLQVIKCSGISEHLGLNVDLKCKLILTYNCGSG